MRCESAKNRIAFLKMISNIKAWVWFGTASMQQEKMLNSFLMQK